MRLLALIVACAVCAGGCYSYSSTSRKVGKDGTLSESRRSINSVSGKGLTEAVEEGGNKALAFLSSDAGIGILSLVGLGGVGTAAKTIRDKRKAVTATATDERERARLAAEREAAAYDAGRADAVALLHPGPRPGAVPAQPPGPDRADSSTGT